MGIPVKCPNGHEFRVKDKYAGKKGVCPFCVGQVLVHVPDALSSEELRSAYDQAVFDELSRGKTTSPSSQVSSPLSDSSVFDSVPDVADPSASSSRLGSSVVRHNIRCPCGHKVPMWFAKCPACGRFLEHA